MRRPIIYSWIGAVLALATLAASPAPTAIHISGGGIAASDWTIDQLQKQLADQIKSVDYSSHGQKHVFQCVPLVELLKDVGVSTDLKMKAGADPKVKNPQVRLVIAVRGRDGYAAAFSLAELLPSLGNRAVWVAMLEDGQPLADSDGPVRLIVPDDKMPARGVHQVESIVVVDMSQAAATQP